MNSNCEISNEETDQQEEAQDDENFGTKRSYECTFCKRGFTNAQALGGHMNIHRKDRAKDKQITTLNSSLPHKYFNNEEYSMTTPPFASGFSNQSTNYDMYFHPPPALNLRNQSSYAFQHGSHDPRFRATNLSPELRGANLTLQIGPSHVDNNAHKDRKRAQKDNEVDLELRLGHHPY